MLIKISSADGQAPEWAMIEMQGSPESLTGEAIAEIGTLHVSPSVRLLHVT